jgi:hypothetical protein
MLDTVDELRISDFAHRPHLAVTGALPAAPERRP